MAIKKLHMKKNKTNNICLSLNNFYSIKKEVYKK